MSYRDSIAANTSDDLLPCPFCGCGATFEHLKDGRWSIGCADIDGDCMGFQSLTTFATKRESIIAWNTRTPPPPVSVHGVESRALIDTNAIASAVVQEVCELSDRQSPTDQPDLLQVKVDELHLIVLGNIEDALEPRAMGLEGAEYVEIAGRVREIDASIAPLVRALNNAGLETVACCSGHGNRPGCVALADGREIIIARDFAEARRIDALFPVGANGEPVASPPPADGEAR